MHICVKKSALKPVPKGWGFRDAAESMSGAPTAHAVLVTHAKALHKGVMLVRAAVRGMGLVAVRVAKA